MSVGAAAFLFVACGSGSNSGSKAKMFSTVGDVEVTSIEEMNEIASVKDGPNGELLVADLSKVGSPKALLLSDLAEDLRIVKLDDADEALVKSGNVWLSGWFPRENCSGKKKRKILSRRTVCSRRKEFC